MLTGLPLLVSVSLEAAPQTLFGWRGHPTTAVTPFDLKVMASGFYQIDPSTPSPERLSLSQIFEAAAVFHYRRDNAADDWQTPARTEQLQAGDCEDFALWVYNQLKKNGYAGARIMVGKFDAADARFHTWAVCSVGNGDDYIIDPALQTRVWKRSELLPELYQPQYSFDGRNKYSHIA